MCIGRIVKDMRALGKFGEAEEYVNNGYVDLIDSGREVNFTNLYHFSRNSLNKGEEFLIKKDAEFQIGTTKCCASCHEEKPVGYFGITKNNSLGKRSIQPYCRDCAKKYFNQYVGKARIAWNEQEKKRYKKISTELNDAYIKKYLRNYGWETDKITSNTISFARKHIIQIRGIKVKGEKIPPELRLSKILKAA